MMVENVVKRITWILMEKYSSNVCTANEMPTEWIKLRMFPQMKVHLEIRENIRRLALSAIMVVWSFREHGNVEYCRIFTVSS